RSVVVLPQPLGPRSVTNWLSLMSRSRSDTAATSLSPAPKRFDSPLMVMPAISSSYPVRSAPPKARTRASLTRYGGALQTWDRPKLRVLYAPGPALHRFAPRALHAAPHAGNESEFVLLSCGRSLASAARRDPAAPDPVGEPDGGADDRHVDHGERSERLGAASLVEIEDRDGERDRAGAEQQDRGGQLLDHRYEHQEPAGEQPGSDQRQRHLAHRRRPRGAEDLRALLERGVDLAQ